jgi:hypothetical protein
VSLRDLKSLKALEEERTLMHLICVTLERSPRVVGGIRLVPIELFLDELWAGA